MFLICEFVSLSNGCSHSVYILGLLYLTDRGITSDTLVCPDCLIYYSLKDLITGMLYNMITVNTILNYLVFMTLLPINNLGITIFSNPDCQKTTKFSVPIVIPDFHHELTALIDYTRTQ